MSKLFRVPVSYTETESMLVYAETPEKAKEIAQNTANFYAEERYAEAGEAEEVEEGEIFSPSELEEAGVPTGERAKWSDEQPDDFLTGEAGDY